MSKTNKGISPNLVTYVLRFIDVLIIFWGPRSKVKITAGNDPKTVWMQYLRN